MPGGHFWTLESPDEYDGRDSQVVDDVTSDVSAAGGAKCN